MSITIEPCVFIKEAWKNGEDGISYEQYKDIVLVLNSLKKWEWIEEIEFVDGIFTNNEDFNLISDSIDGTNHTGSTFSYMLKKVKKVAGTIIKREVHNCAICLSEDSDKFILLECSHRFHEKCFTNKGIKLCPLCRGKTVPNFYRRIFPF